MPAPHSQSSPQRHPRLLALGLALVALLAPAGIARAAGPPAGHAPARRATHTVTTTVTASNTPVLVGNLDKAPAGYRLTARRVLATAEADPQVRAALAGHRRWIPYEYTRGPAQWQVSWFSDTKPEQEKIQVYLSDVSGQVTAVWTGYQVAWTMARGYPGAFGRQVNAWYLWAALSVLFVAPFLPWPRRWLGGADADAEAGPDAGAAASRWRPWLFVLDLLMLLGFSLSLAFFNHADIGMSVPLIYPFLIFLLVRMLLLANGRGLPGRALRSVPASWLGIGTVFLMAFRIGLNVLNSNVIDVGYAGVIGADKLIHGHPLYGNWPPDNRYGDTYGPVSYYAYVPFRLLFGWTGHWDTLPAAHAAAICFDLVAVGGLYLLGRRLRGNRLGVTLAYLWAAYPFTLYAMNSNTNDSLVAAALVLALLAIGSAPARGVLAAVAGLAKFAPLALAPLFLRGVEERPRERSIAAYVLVYGLTAFALMLPVLLNHDVGWLWRDSIEYQSNRVTPFSIWGLWGGLTAVQNLLQGAVVALGVGVALLPGRRGLMEVAALGAAVLVALQLTLNYWLYPYIVWFLPLVLVALVFAHPERSDESAPARDEAAPVQAPPARVRIVSS